MRLVVSFLAVLVLAVSVETHEVADESVNCAQQPCSASSCCQCCPALDTDLVNCSNLNLAGVPDFADIRDGCMPLTLKLSGNRIQTIEEHIFDNTNLKRVTVLDLSSNNLTALGINDESLSHLSSLRQIYLSGNKGLRAVPIAVAKVARERDLSVMNLSNCGISAIERNTFKGGTISILDLSNNSIKHLTEDALAGISPLSLTLLNLENNELQSIDSNSGIVEICNEKAHSNIVHITEGNQLQCSCELTWLRQHMDCLSKNAMRTECPCPPDSAGVEPCFIWNYTYREMCSHSSKCKWRIIEYSAGGGGGGLVLCGLAGYAIWRIRRRNQRYNRSKSGSEDRALEDSIFIVSDELQPSERTALVKGMRGAKRKSLEHRSRLDRGKAGIERRSNSGSGSSSFKSSDQSSSIDGELRSFQIPYRALKKRCVIGEGGSGIVYRARWNKDNVAVKKLRVQASVLLDREKEDFKHEAFLMSKLRHPNIVLLMGVCLEEKHMCIVTEHMELGSVDNILRDTNKTLEPLKIHQMLCDAARGMAYLHAQNPPIIHRDLKSSNLLVDKHLTVKVGDFGVARLLPRLTEAHVTKVPGTLRWTAPELLINSPCLSKKADVYSFGIVIWEFMAVPQIPFQHIDRDYKEMHIQTG